MPSETEAAIMWCRRVRQQIVPYVDGKLTGGRHAAVAAHLRSCRACSAAAQGLRELHAVLDRQPEVSVPLEFEAKVFRRIRSTEPEPSTRTAWRWLVPIAAGAFAVGLALVYVGREVPGPGARFGEPDAGGPAHSPVAPTPVGEPLVARGSGQAASPVEYERAEALGRGAAPQTRLLEEASGGIPKDVPSELFSAPGLFVDFPIIWELEKFEHYETIWTLSNRGPASASRGG